jgi:hypothetical protein
MHVELELVIVIFFIAAWIRQLHLKELSVNVKFHDDNETPKQLKK